MRFLSLMLFLIPLWAQTPDAPPRRPDPKNLKVLKAEEVGAAMRSYTTALGVRCDFCHVQGDFASDENKHKAMARQMISMVQHANEVIGESKVTCFMCHRGESEPKSSPAQSGGENPARASRE